MKFFRCDCGAEGLSVEKEPFDDSNRVWISFWANEYPLDKFDKKQRREAKKYVRKKGHPFTDNVILDKNTARELADFLYKITEEKT